jgi:hypothetical protein
MPPPSARTHRGGGCADGDGPSTTRAPRGHTARACVLSPPPSYPRSHAPGPTQYHRGGGCRAAASASIYGGGQRGEAAAGDQRKCCHADVGCPPANAAGGMSCGALACTLQRAPPPPVTIPTHALRDCVDARSARAPSFRPAPPSCLSWKRRTPASWESCRRPWGGTGSCSSSTAPSRLHLRWRRRHVLPAQAPWVTMEAVRGPLVPYRFAAARCCVSTARAMCVT